MSLSAKISLGGREHQTVVIICGDCSKPTAHEILTNVCSRDSSPDGDIDGEDDYLTVQCQGCKAVSFCVESCNSEDTDPDGQPTTSRKLLPGRISGRPRLRDLHYLPRELRTVYEESRSALMEGLGILTGIGIRAIVETVCNEQAGPGRDLAKKITGLVTISLITQKEANILHDLRFMGNEAAHKVKTHTPRELNLAFDVVEHLLRTVYLLPEQTKRLPKQSRHRQIT